MNYRFSMHLLMFLAAAGCVGYEEISAAPAGPGKNLPPRIETFSPPSKELFEINLNDTQAFKVTSIDDPNVKDRFFGYSWELDNSKVGNGNFYTFVGTKAGYARLVVSVWDCPGVGPENNYEGLDECQDEPRADSFTAQEKWLILVK